MFKFQVGKVHFPIFAILAAVPGALRAAAAEVKDAQGADSPGGSKVTSGEIMEIVGVFLGKLAEAILPAVLKANGVPMPPGGILE